MKKMEFRGTATPAMLPPNGVEACYQGNTVVCFDLAAHSEPLIESNNERVLIMEMTIAQRKLLEFLQGGFKSRPAAFAHMNMDPKEFNTLWTACKRRVWLAAKDDGVEVKYTTSAEGDNALNPITPKEEAMTVIESALAAGDMPEETGMVGIQMNLDDVLVRRIPSPGVVAAELDSLHRALADDCTSIYTAELIRVAADYCRMCAAAHLAA